MLLMLSLLTAAPMAAAAALRLRLPAAAGEER
jgi:hypothetical protein